MPPPRRKNPFAKAQLAPRIPPPEQPLTQIQLKILDAIKKITNEKGFAPSMRDLSLEVGRAVDTISHHLDTLQARGYVTRNRKVPRSIRLVPPSGGDAA